MTHQIQTTAVYQVGQLLADQVCDGLADTLRVLLNEVMKIERAAASPPEGEVHWRDSLSWLTSRAGRCPG